MKKITFLMAVIAVMWCGVAKATTKTNDMGRDWNTSTLKTILATSTVTMPTVSSSFPITVNPDGSTNSGDEMVYNINSTTTLTVRPDDSKNETYQNTTDYACPNVAIAAGANYTTILPAYFEGKVGVETTTISGLKINGTTSNTTYGTTIAVLFSDTSTFNENKVTYATFSLSKCRAGASTVAANVTVPAGTKSFRIYSEAKLTSNGDGTYKIDYTSGTAIAGLTPTYTARIAYVNATLQRNFNISASVGTGSGTISGTGYYNEGASCSALAATPDANFTFQNWTESGNPVSTNATFPSFTVTADRTLVANFVSSATPIMSVSTNTLSNFVYSSANGPSLSQSFTVTGANLTANVSITAPTDYEVSTDNSNFGATKSIDYGSGTLTDIPVYVRLKAGLTANTAYNNQVVSLSSGSASQTVTCSGRVSDVLPTTAASNAVASNTLHTTTDLSWSAGNGAKYLVLVSINNDVATAYPPVNGTTYTVGSTTHTGYIVGYVGTATAASVTGLTAGTTNYLAVFTYNDNSGSSGYESYLTGTPATASAATIVASNATDYFRTTTSGNWATTGIWESSANGTDGWHLASLTPGASATSVTITTAGSPVTASAEIGTNTINMENGTKFIWNGSVDFGNSTTKKAFVGSGTVNFDAQTSSASMSTSNYYINFAPAGNATTTINIGLGTSSQSGTTNFNLLGVAQANLPAGVQLNVTNNTSGTARIQIPRDALTARKLHLGTGVAITRGDGNGGVYTIGELVADAGSILEGENSTNAGKEITYTIGGLNTDCLIAGVLRQFNETSSNNNVNIVKEGSGKLTISGNSTHKGSLALNAGTLELTGSMTAITTATVATGATLTVAPGKQLTVNTSISNSGTLNLNSNENGTATFVNTAVAGSTAIATVQQYLPTGRNWYVGIPFTNESNILASTLTAAGATSVNYWDETTGAWVSGYAGNLERGRGYIAVSNSGTATNNISFTGTLNDGNVDVAVSRTAGVTKEGFNLISNPYPSYLNAMTAINNKSAKMETTIWYRTKGTSYSFETVNTASGEGTNGVTGYIPPMQAFWVRVKPNTDDQDPIYPNNSETLNFTNAMRSHANPQGVTTTLLKAKSNVEPIKIRLQVSNGVNSDETLIYTNENALDSYDVYDSHKMSNDNAAIPELYTVVGSENLVINGFNQLPVNVEIPLGFKTGQANSFSIKATELSNLRENETLILKDKQLNTETILTEGTEVSFNSEITNTTNRFSLMLKVVGVTTDMEQSTKPDWKINVNSEGKIIVSGLQNGSSIHVFNAIGQQISVAKSCSDVYMFSDKLISGIYLVSVNNQVKKVIIN